MARDALVKRGAAAFLVKPVFADTLINAIDTAIQPH
jgi:FixJ family two-component response regulator